MQEFIIIVILFVLVYLYVLIKIIENILEKRIPEITDKLDRLGKRLEEDDLK